MTLNTLLTKLNYFSGKDKRGKTFKITEFNTLLPTVQDMLFAQELDKLLSGDVQNIPESRLSITPLRVFKASETFTVDDGFFPLPGDYVRYISVLNNYKEVNILPEKDVNSRRTSVMRNPSVRSFCYLTGTDIVLFPTNIGLTELQYFRTPTVPYFDYCQDVSTLNEIFMPVGSYVAEDEPGIQGLYDSTGSLIQMSVIHSSGIYPHTSTTIELEWEAIYHDHFVMAMLSLVGINIQMNELTQYAEAKQ